MDVGPGDDVLVPAFTFLATYEAVMEVGAIPIMVDIDDTLNLDPNEIEKKKTPYTKAVIPVHMCGSAANIDKIVDVARKISCWFWRTTRRVAARATKAKAGQLRRYGNIQLRLRQNSHHRRRRHGDYQ